MIDIFRVIHCMMMMMMMMMVMMMMMMMMMLPNEKHNLELLGFRI